MSHDDWILAALMLAVSLLYSSVGHAGSSGYQAAMAVMGLSAVVMKPTALVLNICVASIASCQFVRAGRFSWKLLWPFTITAVPLSFWGGSFKLNDSFYKPLVGVVVLVSAIRMLREIRRPDDGVVRLPNLPVCLLSGAIIGLLSGVTGTGGGIFLTPLLLFTRWADAKVASGVSAVFILLNSLSGLAGTSLTGASFPPALPIWCGVVLIGGLIGSHFGSRKFNSPTLRFLLAIVLITASFKLFQPLWKPVSPLSASKGCDSVPTGFSRKPLSHPDGRDGIPNYAVLTIIPIASTVS